LFFVILDVKLDTLAVAVKNRKTIIYSESLKP